ncbi:MAG: DUF2254 family protein [Betaproteobacteria bacterium]
MRRAFDEFLFIPTCVIAAFLLLAALSYTLDQRQPEWLQTGRQLLEAYVFSEPKATAEVLSTVAGALATIVSITVTLLLIALQQSASSLTHQIYDQFLRRRYNQFYFGFFVGVSLYALLTLATVGPVNPVFGAALTFVLTAAALYLLIVMFYTTIDQMRPSAIIEAIHDHVLLGRARQRALLDGTRRSSHCDAPVRHTTTAARHGFVTAIDIGAIAAAAERCESEIEVELRVSIGSFVALGDTLATVKAHFERDAAALGEVVERAIERSRDRDLRSDPLDGIEEMETIAWTTISTAQSDPDPALIAICGLRDLLARWTSGKEDDRRGKPAPVVYPDNVMPRLMDAFESLAVSASESMQHQTYAEILRALTLMFDRLPPAVQQRANDIVLCSLSGLGDHILTAGLRDALEDTATTLRQSGRGESAAAVEEALTRLGRSFGRLASRGTRATV